LSNAPPKIATALVVPLYLCLFIFLLGLLYSKGGFSPVFWAMLLFCVTLGVGLSGLLSTQVSNQGVTQITLRGRRSIAWSEVTDVKLTAQTITLVGPTGELTLPLIMFSDLDATVAFVTDHLPGNVRDVLGLNN
jgi:hypothetical protein